MPEAGGVTAGSGAPRPSGRRVWPWACALAAAGALLVAALAPPGVTSGPSAALDWQPDRLATEPWRLLTAAWVHLGAAHLTLNLGALAMLAWLGHEAGAGRREVQAWALAWPLTHLLLWVLIGLQPCLTGTVAGFCGPSWSLRHYGGLSGVLHAGVAVLVAVLWRAPDGARRRVGRVLGVGLLLKLAAEQPWGPPLPWDAALGIARVPLAHLAGALAGLGAGAWSARRRAERP